MNLKATIFLLTTILLTSILHAQQQPYIVTKAPFSTNDYDEFAPVFYHNVVVFCSNKSRSVSDGQGHGVVKMYCVDTTDNNSSIRLFSKSLKSKLNDGPATFNRNADTIYFSRNLNVIGNYKTLSHSHNKLGLFFSVYEGGKWGKTREMRFNNEWYNITMPCLSYDGKQMFFVSDMPDGYGGSDIYYSQWKNGYWGEPVNLGPQINTKGNETYPFIDEAGELFFSSDGYKGLGGKDIFVTKQRGKEWFPPMMLDPPVNSEYDDFGIVTDALMNEGYFSSNRGKTIDIFRFRTNVNQVWFGEPQKENQYCFTISDTGSIQVDTLKLQYVWNFGDNSLSYGTNVRHCFAGPGNYSINLDITDRRTGKLFFRKLSYNIDLVDYDQPFITSAYYTVAGETIEFNGLKSFTPGYNITGYFWDFGDSTTYKGEKVSHVFKEAGEYTVRLGLTLKSVAKNDVVKRAVTKKIIVFNSPEEKTAFLASRQTAKQDITDIRQFENATVNSEYSSEADFSKDAVFQVELMSSRTSTPLNDTFFRNVPSKYTVKEIFDASNGVYNYIVDEQMSLMAAYPAYTEMITSGYNDVSVKTFVLTDPAQKQLHMLKKNYGVLTDTYFDSNNKLITNAYLMLDQIVMLMNRYPDIKLEVVVHTDNQGTPTNLLTVSQVRAQVIVNYLINRGINGNRLTAKGQGSAKPVASNATWLEKRLNRRIDFIILPN